MDIENKLFRKILTFFKEKEGLLKNPTDKNWSAADLIIRQYLNNGASGFGIRNVKDGYNFLKENKELLISLKMVSRDGVNNSGLKLWSNYQF